MPPLQTLSLYGNQICVEGAKFIREALAITKAPLQTLSLYGNQIGDKGAKFIGEALAITNAPFTNMESLW
jgi:Leucine Rich repeat